MSKYTSNAQNAQKRKENALSVDFGERESKKVPL